MISVEDGEKMPMAVRGGSGDFSGNDAYWGMSTCPYCQSSRIVKRGHNRCDSQRLLCRDWGRTFTTEPIGAVVRTRCIIKASSST